MMSPGAAGTVQFRSNTGIMPALDVESADDACRIVEQTTRIEGIVAYKLGLTLTLRGGLSSAVEQLRAVTDLPVIYDHQKAGADLPDMAKKFASTCKEAGADGLILFPIAGPTAVKQFVGQTIAQGLLPLVGGDLPLPDYNARNGGFVSGNALNQIFEQSIEIGARHFIVPATDTRKIRRITRLLHEHIATPALFMPGIGALGGSVETAFKAAPRCHVYAVVGRGIYGAGDPAEAAKTLAGEALKFA